MSTRARRRVLLVHPHPDDIGGAEAVTAHLLLWFLSHEDVEVTLLTLAPVDWGMMERVAGRSIPVDRTVNRVARVPRVVTQFAGGLTRLKMAFLHREAKRLARDFQLCVGAFSEIDFGRPGFQYIHHPAFAPKSFLRRYGIFVGNSIVDRYAPAEFLYRAAVSLISGDRAAGYRRNVTAVNSQFMRTCVREAYGIEAKVLYPVFLGKALPAGLPWEQRRFRLVALGRIAPDKGYLALLDLFASVHRRFPSAEFVIAGRRADLAYEAQLRQRANELGIAVAIEADIDRPRVLEILSESMFFVHAREYEHFGIAILEAIASGCLAFVHDSGGQTEIVRPALLRYRQTSDVPHGIDVLLHDEGTRASVAAELRATANEFLGCDFGKELEGILLPIWAGAPAGADRAGRSRSDGVTTA